MLLSVVVQFLCVSGSLILLLVGDEVSAVRIDVCACFGADVATALIDLNNTACGC